MIVDPGRAARRSLPLPSWMRAGAASPSAMSLLFSAPAWLLMLGVVALPLLTAIFLSFTSESLIRVAPLQLVGLRNYEALLTVGFVRALTVTMTIVAAGLVIQMPIGFVIAEVLHRELPGFRVVRSALLVPMLLTPVAVGLMWRFLFNPDLGLIRFVLSGIKPDLNWFGDPILAMLAVVLVDAWQHIPFVIVMMLAGLSALPVDAIEAASLDGAKWWSMNRYVIIPLLWPVILVTLLFRFIDSFRVFDLIYALTNGGPGAATTSVSILAYQNTFTYFEVAQGATIAVAMAAAIFPVYFAFLRLTRI